MTRVMVDAGICGFSTTVEVSKLSSRKVTVTLTSDCEMVTQMAEDLGELDWQDTLGERRASLVDKTASRCLRHTACPVPVAIIKAIEVEVGLALPRDVAIHFETVG